MGILDRLTQATRQAASKDLSHEWGPDIAQHLSLLPLADQARSSRMLQEAIKRSGREWNYLFGDRERRVVEDEYVLRLAGLAPVVRADPMRDGSVGYTLVAARPAPGSEQAIRLSLKLPRTLAGLPLIPIGADGTEVEQLFGPVGSKVTAAAVRPLDPRQRSRFLVQALSVGTPSAAMALATGWRRWVIRDPANTPPEVAPVGAGGVYRACVGPRRSWFHAWLAPDSTMMLVAAVDLALATHVTQELIGRPPTGLSRD